MRICGQSLRAGPRVLAHRRRHHPVSANVTKVLRRLGLEEGLIEDRHQPQSYVSRAWDTGETSMTSHLRRGPRAALRRSLLNIHRGDLHAVLETRPSRPERSPSTTTWRTMRENGGQRHPAACSTNGATARPTSSSAPTASAPRCAKSCSGRAAAIHRPRGHRAIFPSERLQRAQHPRLHKVVGHRPPPARLLS